MRELEAGWDRKWSGLEDSPLAAFLQEEQVSGNAAHLRRRCRGDSHAVAFRPWGSSRRWLRCPSSR